MVQKTVLAHKLASVPPKAGDATRQAIIDSAERMFSDHGIAAVSIRSILTQAGANTAAVHYHFGSKDNLITEAFTSRANRLAAERFQRLDDVFSSSDTKMCLEQILTAFIEPGFFRGADTLEAGIQFARLRARLTTENPDLAVHLLSDCFNESSHQFIAAIEETLHHLTKVDVQWRFHALLGVVVYTLAGLGRIQSLTVNSCDPTNLHIAIEHLVSTLAGMFRAPSTS
jgi:AcrR family transcriptional regulator